MIVQHKSWNTIQGNINMTWTTGITFYMVFPLSFLCLYNSSANESPYLSLPNIIKTMLLFCVCCSNGCLCTRNQSAFHTTNFKAQTKKIYTYTTPILTYFRYVHSLYTYSSGLCSIGLLSTECTNASVFSLCICFFLQ